MTDLNKLYKQVGGKYIYRLNKFYTKTTATDLSEQTLGNDVDALLVSMFVPKAELELAA